MPRGNFFAVQWLGLHAFIAKSPGSIPGWELRYHKLHGVTKKKNGDNNSTYIMVVLWKFNEIICVKCLVLLSAH